MATTTNFGWETPDDTDLVKDGAAAIRTLGGAIDTSLVDLKGGTTGQVLSKASNTDMDFTWVTSDDANAIQNTIVDAKGDLISATAADTPARLASSGVNNDVLTVDTSTSTGLKWSKLGLTLISRASVSAQTTLTFDSVFSSSYDTYLIIVEDMFAATGTDDLLFQFRYGSTTRNTAYYGSSGYLARGTTTWGNNSVTNGSSITLVTDIGASNAGLSNGFLWVNQVGQSSQRGSIKGEFFNGAAFDLTVVAGATDSAETFTGFILSCASNITGTVAVYGLAK